MGACQRVIAVNREALDACPEMLELLVWRLTRAERFGVSYPSLHGYHHQRLQLDKEIQDAKAVYIWPLC